MASIFNTLHIGYSGLNAAQVGIDTTGHNISNAETEGYSRQRVVTAAATAVGIDPGLRGNGTQIVEIARIFDKFVFDRYKSTSQSKEYSDTMKNSLEELSTYFPEIDNVGIKNDLQTYFDLWQSFASNPSNTALKVALAQQTQTLSQHITQTRSQITNLQGSLNDQLAVNVDEVNRIATQITQINQSINEAEASGISNANDLRDQRNQLEMTLSKLVGAQVYVGKTVSNTTVDRNIAVEEGSYTIQVAGFNLVDGINVHPIGLDKIDNKNGYNNLFYERQDGARLPFPQSQLGGRIGALVELRGFNIGTNGEFEDGFLQETINNLDTFARGLIESTNSIYAQSATATMQSNPLTFSDNQALMSTDENFKEGAFSVIVYDIDGKEVARRSIEINQSTVMNNAMGTNTLYDGTPNSIIEQMAQSKDDTGDNNALNDIDDMIRASFSVPQNLLNIRMESTYASKGYTFAIQDNGTNFAGVTGISRFFDGYDAKTITLEQDIGQDASSIRGFKSPANGDNQTALDMVELQFQSIDFKHGNTVSNETIYGYFDTLVTKIGTKTNSAILTNDSITAQLNAVKQEFDSISKVSIDEEMANLIRYQTSYGAAAKVITTIDQMMTTLLGLKQ